MIPLHELKRKFATKRQCLKYILHLKLGDEPFCPKCEKIWKRIIIDEYWFSCHYRCSFKECITKYTIFFGSSTPLPKWFLAIYLMIETKNKITGAEIGRQIKVGSAAAHRIKRKILELSEEINLEEFFDYTLPSPPY